MLKDDLGSIFTSFLSPMSNITLAAEGESSVAGRWAGRRGGVRPGGRLLGRSDGQQRRSDGSGSSSRALAPPQAPAPGKACSTDRNHRERQGKDQRRPARKCKPMHWEGRGTKISPLRPRGERSFPKGRKSGGPPPEGAPSLSVCPKLLHGAWSPPIPPEQGRGGCSSRDCGSERRRQL